MATATSVDFGDGGDNDGNSGVCDGVGVDCGMHLIKLYRNHTFSPVI